MLKEPQKKHSPCTPTGKDEVSFKMKTNIGKQQLLIFPYSVSNILTQKVELYKCWNKYKQEFWHFFQLSTLTSLTQMVVWRKRETEGRKEGEMQGAGDWGERKEEEEKWGQVAGGGTEERMTDERRRRREGVRERQEREGRQKKYLLCMYFLKKLPC